MELFSQDEYLRSYRGISSSLKRKFVKKINVNDAIAAYDSLSKEQNELGYTELAADCKLSAALLDQNTSSATGSTVATKGLHSGNHFVASAQLYAQNNDKKLAAYCYESALGTEEGPLSWMTMMEAGRTAMDLNNYEDATHFFKKALQTAKGKMEKQLSSEQLASSLIHQNFFMEALKVFSVTEVSNDSKLTVVLLNLLVNEEWNGSGSIYKLNEQLAQWSIEQTKKNSFGYQCLMIQVVDNVVAGEIWKHLNRDQQYLFTKYLVTGK